MRMVVMVAGRVLSAAHHHLVARHLLGSVGNDITFALLCHHAPDIAFLSLDIIGNLARLIAVFAVIEYRFAFPFFFYVVPHTVRIDNTAVHVHADVV